MPSVVVVTEPEFRRAEAVFAASSLRCVVAPPAEAELAAAARAAGARHAIVGPFVYSGDLYAALPSGGVLARYGVGHDGIDKGLAHRSRVSAPTRRTCFTSQCRADDAADSGRAPGTSSAVSTGMRGAQWTPKPGVELQGKTLASYRLRHDRARHGAHCKSGFRHARRRLPASAPAPRGDQDFDAITTDFGDAVSGADYVSLHIPASAGERGFIDEARLAQMSRTCVDHQYRTGSRGRRARALRRSCRGADWRAALDVFAQGPYEPP